MGVDVLFSIDPALIIVYSTCNPNKPMTKRTTNKLRTHADIQVCDTIASVVNARMHGKQPVAAGDAVW